MPLDRGLPGHQGLDGIARAPDFIVGNQTQAARVFHRLVRRTVFAEADAVVREHVDHPLTHERRHAHRIAAVVREREKGAPVG